MHVAAVAAHRRNSTLPASTVAAPRRIGLSLALAKISILLLSFLSLSFLLHAAPRAFPARRGTARRGTARAPSLRGAAQCAEERRTPRGAPPALLLSTLAARSPRAGLNRPVNPCPPAPGCPRGRASRRPCRPPAPGAPLPPARALRHSRRPPTPCAVNCVTADHRRNRPPRSLAATPLWRLRPGSLPPLVAPARLSLLLTIYFLPSAVPSYLVKPIIV